jgi:hypothetical protein
MCNFPFSKMQGKICNIRLELRDIYENWSYPVLSLTRSMLPDALHDALFNFPSSVNLFDICVDVFEYGFEKTMHEEQKALLREIITQDKKYTFIQRIMGAGKTTVLFPFLALYYLFLHLHTNTGISPQYTYAFLVVPHPQLIEQTFQRVLHTLGWIGVVQIQVRTKLESHREELHTFPDRRCHLPLLIVCTDSWMKFQMLRGQFEGIRPVLVLFDEFDDCIDPNRSTLHISEHPTMPDTFGQVFTYNITPLELTNMFVEVIDRLQGWMNDGFQRGQCESIAKRYYKSERGHFPYWAVWYVAIRDIFKMTYMLHFGPHPRKLTAVPYIAQGVFSINEEFQDKMLCIIATLYCILKNGTTDFQNNEFMKYIIETKDITRLPSEWTSYYPLFQYIENPKKLENLLPSLTNTESIIWFMQDMILDRFTVYTGRTTCTFPNLFTHYKQGISYPDDRVKVIGMSGSLHIPSSPKTDPAEPIHLGDIPPTLFDPSKTFIKKDPVWEQVLEKMEEATSIQIDDNQMISYLQNIPFVERQHAAYIDVGSTNLNYPVVGDILVLIKNMIENEYIPRYITHVIYPGEQDKPYIYDVKSQTSIRYMDVLPGDNDTWFYFFDQAHCRGFDVKTLFKILEGSTYVDHIINIIGYVAISAKNTLNEVAQAAFRLRYILTPQQQVVLLYPQQIVASFTPPPSFSSLVYEYLRHRQRRQYRSREKSLKKQIENALKNTQHTILPTESRVWWLSDKAVIKERWDNEHVYNGKEVVLEIHTMVEVEVKTDEDTNVQIPDYTVNIRASYSGNEKLYRFSTFANKIEQFLFVKEFDESGTYKQICNAVHIIATHNEKNIILLCPQLGNFDMHFILENFSTIFIEGYLRKQQPVFKKIVDGCDICFYIIYILLVYTFRHPNSCAIAILHNLVTIRHINRGENIVPRDVALTELFGFGRVYINDGWIKRYKNVIDEIQTLLSTVQNIQIQTYENECK